MIVEQPSGPNNKTMNRKRAFSLLSSSSKPVSNGFYLISILLLLFGASTADPVQSSCGNLDMDHFCLVVNSSVHSPVRVMFQVTECYKCEMRELVTLDPTNVNFEIQILDYFPFMFEVHSINEHNKTETLACSLGPYSLGEYGEYRLYIDSNETGSSTVLCTWSPGQDPVDSYIPIYIATAVLLGLAILYAFIKLLYKKKIISKILSCWRTDHLIISELAFQDLGTPTNVDAVPVAATEKKRLKSLDTFRGISILMMIFVNYGGGGYHVFHHSPWNGLTFADLVFPWFMWIMGVSMAFSFRGLFKRNTPLLEILFKICRRTVTLFAIGLFLSTSRGRNDLTKLRIPGVLQRFAISYFAMATLELVFGRKTDQELNNTTGRLSALREIVLFWPQWIISLFLVGLWLLVTFVLPVPGCPTGYLGPGGLADSGMYVNCTGGAAGYLDRIILTGNHIYGHPTCEELYLTEIPYDPEGILGCLTSIFITFLGMQAGKILLVYKDNKNRLVRWCVWSLVTGAIAAILCKGGKEGGWIPLNKNLWSLSFVLAMSSMAFFLLAYIYIIVDIKEWWGGQPFVYPGMNSILAYVGHELCEDRFPVNWSVPSNHEAQLAMHLYGVVFWTIVTYALFKKRVFIII